MNATSKFHDSMCFGHVCKDMASGLWGHLDSKISSSSWNAKGNFNFSNQEFSLPQDDLYF